MFIHKVICICFILLIVSACSLDAKISEISSANSTRNQEIDSGNVVTPPVDLPVLPVVVDTFKYISTLTTSNKINFYKVNTNSLEFTKLNTFTVASSVGDYQYTNNGTRLFTSTNTGIITLYTVNYSSESFSLSALGSLSTPGAPSGWGICAAPDGSTVHYVEYGSNKIHSFKVTNNILSFVGSTIVSNYVVNCLVSSDSKYLFTTGYYGGTTQSFSISPSTGALTVISSLGGNNGPGWIAQSEDSKFVFIVNQNGSQLVAYEVSLSGSLTEVDRVSTPNLWPDFLDVRDNGQKIYINGQGTQTSVAFFNRLTKKIDSFVNNLQDNGSPEWFYMSKDFPGAIMNHGSNLELRRISTDFTLSSSVLHTFTGENGFKELFK